MVATHSVKHNGVWYKAGQEIPEGKSQKSSDPTNPSTYTKTDINRMSIDDLKALGTEQGIENAEELKGDDLKKLLIEKLGL